MGMAGGVGCGSRVWRGGSWVCGRYRAWQLSRSRPWRAGKRSCQTRALAASASEMVGVLCHGGSWLLEPFWTMMVGWPVPVRFQGWGLRRL